MGLATWGRTGLANSAGPGFRSIAKTIAALMAGAAAIALSAHAAKAQQAAQPVNQQQADQKKKADEKAAAEGTLLDKILVISRTGETAIQSLASASHVDQEQLDRRMATTPNEMLLGVPGVTVQADARRVSSSINIRGLQDFGRVAVIVDGARAGFPALGPRHAVDLLCRSRADQIRRRHPRPDRQHLWLRRHRRRRLLRHQGCRRFPQTRRDMGRLADRAL